jgi:hypothetical protein
VQFLFRGRVWPREAVDEIKRHFGVVAEELRGEIRLVAVSVAALSEETSKQFAAVRSELREEIGEVNAMIRLSYRELDGRLRALETDVSDLRQRLDRVESRLGN